MLIKKIHKLGQNFEGIEIEDEGGQGSAGSHWERATLHNEIMGASTLPDESFSIFTLALFEVNNLPPFKIKNQNITKISIFFSKKKKDSGWYQADYSLAV